MRKQLLLASQNKHGVAYEIGGDHLRIRLAIWSHRLSSSLALLPQIFLVWNFRGTKPSKHLKRLLIVGNGLPSFTSAGTSWGGVAFDGSMPNATRKPNVALRYSP